MNITDEDKKLLEELGLSDIPEDEKQAVLDTVDDRMSKRFVANLLLSLPEDKRPELEKKIEEMDGEDPQKIIEAIIDLHPDAKKVLEDSAKEIVEELKKKPETEEVTLPDANPATAPNTEIDKIKEKTEAGDESLEAGNDQTGTEPEKAPQTQPPVTPSISNDYYRP